MSSFFDDIFSKCQYGFRKAFSTQQCLLVLLEKWKRPIDRGEVFGALLTGTSQSYNSLFSRSLVKSVYMKLLKVYRF